MRTRNSIAVAIAQIPQSRDISDNLRRIADAVAQARAARADILCLPECALTGYGPAFHKSSAPFDPSPVASALSQARAMARDADMAILLGAHLLLANTGEAAPAHGWTNSCLLISPRGRVLTRYDKAHLYGRDPEYYLAGRQRPAVATVRGGRIGIQICFDIRFPEPFRALALAGAHVIVVPSFIHGPRAMWKGPVVAAHVSSRAAENGRFVVFVNAAGPNQNVPSMIADPRGDIILRARRGVRQILTARLRLDHVNNDFLRRRRADLYH